MKPESPIGSCSYCGYLNYVEVTFGGPKNRLRHRCADCGGKVTKPEVLPMKIQPARTLNFTRIPRKAKGAVA